MTSETFVEQAKRLQEVNGVIGKLEPTIQAAAFQVLLPYVTARPSASAQARHDGGGSEDAGAPSEDSTDFESFLTKHAGGDTKPHEAVTLIAAYLYSRYGAEPFTAEELRQLGNDAGLIVPNRIDMTLKGAKRDGKSLYAQVQGGFKPTVFGETVFKTTYGVRKGREQRGGVDAGDEA
jgi:hypothetical protein